jgi:hypothetical protein
VDGRNPTDIDRGQMIYRGRPEERQEAGPIDGRADRAQVEVAGRAGRASTAADRAAMIVTSAASSRSVGVPRTTLTSGSSSIDRAYDKGPEVPVTRVPHSADQLAAARQDRVFSA